ncbi:MAG TPA: AI-2E family transporter [Methylomirabilota bacterium]|nr:AI-2E family transporter [Methylomirabilota bacterium]
MSVPSRLPWPLVFQVLGVIAAVALVVATWQIWLLVFAALIVAAAILPAARVGESYRVPRGVTVLAVYVVMAALLALVGRLLWPALSEQSRQFMDQLPELLARARGWLGNVDDFLARWGTEVPTPKASHLEGLVGTLVANSLKVTAGVVGAVVGLVAILVVGAFFVIDAEHLGRGLAALLPRAYRATAHQLTEPVLERIGGYVRGQVLVSICVGIILGVGLSLIGVRYAILIGAIATVLNFVPWIGSFVAFLLALAAALNESVAQAGLTVGLFAVSNLIEGKVLVPYLVGRATGLHPVIVLVGLLMGAHLAGLIGALVAIPFLAATWEIVRTLYVDPRRG